MQYKFQEFIKKYSLLNRDDKVLLSISGGADSLALFKLFIEANIQFEAIHCNYHLRGNESNRDMLFVISLCEKHNVNLHIAHFETEKFAEENNISIEMAARDLRYDYYKVLCKKYAFTKIATAHHLNDQAETFFINILRNTGLNGICGIPILRPLDRNSNEKNIVFCRLIRPLLFLSQAEIMQYIASDDFVVDSTNNTDNYLRNKLRHNVIPQLENISPNFVHQLQNSIDRFKYTRSYINRITKDSFAQKNDLEGHKKIIIPENYSFEELSGYLYFALYDFGFNFKQIDDIAKAINNVGKIFFSKDYELLIDRKYLIIKIINDNTASNSEQILKKVYKKDNIEIFFENKEIFALADRLKVEIVPREKLKSIPTDPNIACLDYNKIDLPLFLTTKKDGDYFYPLGMNKKKKLSDFFIDNKLDLFTKNTTFALRSSKNEILWIVGYRIDDRYKIDNETTNVLVIELCRNE